MKHLFILFLLFCTATLTLEAQVPNYWNNNATSGNENSFPLNQAAGKMCQWLVRATEFSQPTPAPSGKTIHSISFMISTLYPLTSTTYTSFKIILQQATITDLPVGSFYTAGTMDTVYARASVTLSAAGGTWLSFVLDHNYPYDPTKSLIVQMEQCSASGATTVYSLVHSVLAGNRRVFSVGGCPFAAYSLAQTNVVNCGIELISASTLIPTLLYYKFENNPTSGSVLNCAVPGVGTPSATVTSNTLTPGGQFDTCMTAAGVASGGIVTGWNCDFGTSSWTISMWLTIPSTNSGSAYYLFGDAGSGTFRCFHNGIALQDNLVLRGGFTDVPVTGIGPAPTVVTFVYDSAAAQVRAYKDGVLANTVPQTLNIVTGTGFKVGGYSTSTAYIGKMDEFRVWRRALTPAEVLSTWNSDLGGCGILGISHNSNQIPQTYTLYQNYPNPFNPATTISFGMPVTGKADLRIYDILGREVAVLVNDVISAGIHNINFNASSLSSGVYLYTLKTGNFTDTKRMMLVK